MTEPLFDHKLRAMRRDRAVRTGVETFLYDRAFDDCLERMGAIRQSFTTALLAGCPSPEWPVRLGAHAGAVETIDPGPLMAVRAGGRCGDLETLPVEPASFDVCITVGLLGTANDLGRAAAALLFALKPGGLLLGALAGGHSFPRLRAAMLAADRASGVATPRVHPRLDAASLARLLTDTGFVDPVVDVDRVRLTYESLDSLVADLRAMGGTNILAGRARRPILGSGLAAARQSFLDGQSRAEETVEILHFAAWAPSRD